MKAIVTGASGFIGSHLVAKLVSSGFEVAALGRRSPNVLSEPRQKLLEGSVYIQSDLDRPESLESELRNSGFCGPQLHYFFHMAWGGVEGLSDENIEKQTLNIIRTVESYKIAARIQAKRFIFCGTMEESFALSYTEMDHHAENKYNRHVVYSLAKVSARQALKTQYSSGMPEIIFGTNSHVMGLYDERDSFLQVAVHTIIARKEINMSSGEQLFDVINVKDCARAYLAIAKTGIRGHSYWIGSGMPRRLKDYILEMTAILPEVTVNFGSAPFNDVILDRSIFSTTLIEQDTNFKPQYSFADSVLEIYNYLTGSK